MKIKLLIISILVNVNVYCQNWVTVNTNTTVEIKDMYFKDELIGFAVAGQGKILKTIDGGLNWNLIYENSELLQEQSIVTTDEKVYCFGQNFNGLIKKLEFFINLNDFILSTITASFTPQNPICFNNIIYDSGSRLSTDGFIPLVGPIEPSGATVANGASNIYNNGNNLTASDGHYIFKSFDGNNWTNIQFHEPFLSSDLYQSYYDGVNKMRTVTNYPCVVHISNDNGLNWTYNQINIQSLNFQFINAEKVLGLNLFTEENKIYYSTNSGITFDFETVPNPIKKIYSFNNNLSFAYGNNGVIYKSTNSGGLLNKSEVKKNENEIEIFPNPTLDEINIKYNLINVEIESISITDINGRILENFNSSSHIINLQKLSKGTYFIIVETRKGKITKKVIRK